MGNELCKSYNYEYESSGSTHTCELLDKIKTDTPASYISRPGFTHYESSDTVSCPVNFCQNGGTCLPNCHGDGSYTCQCFKDIRGKNCEIDDRVFASCSEAHALQVKVEPGSGYKISVASKIIQVFCDNEWTLIARFSNADDKTWMNDDGSFWYDRQERFGVVYRADLNEDMISEAFWLISGAEFKITKSDDPVHTSLLVTQGSCLNGKTFREKISSYGRFTGSKVWAATDCQGNCNVRYGGDYTTVQGFSQSQCDGEIQTRNRIGFWCDYSAGDGAVMMIGGGGSTCKRADHGIGVTEANAANFAGSPECDFGDNTVCSVVPYALNLWVR